DGLPDLAVANTFNDTLRVLLGNGDGTFQTTHISYVAGRSPYSVAIADFNGDGFPDAVTANFSSNDVSILLNDGFWTGPGGAPARAAAALPAVEVSRLPSTGSPPKRWSAAFHRMPDFLGPSAPCLLLRSRCAGNSCPPRRPRKGPPAAA